MFSPASTPRTAPRKSIYRPSGSVLRTGTPGTPSLTSERGREREYASQTPTALPRRAALRGASPPRSISGESSRTTGGAAYRYEGLEDGGKTILGKDERMGLFSLGALPNEVNEAVQRAEQRGTQLEGHVDIASGYAFVTTPEHCLAWNFAKRTQASPTVYTFPAPIPYEGAHYGSSALYASLHHSGSPEPGLIAVSADGQIRFWGTLGAALAGVDRHQEVVCQLGPEELVDRICAVDSSSYLITTNQSRIFRLTITSQGGRQTPAVAPLVRSNGMFSRASPVLFGADEDRQGIASIAVGDKEAWIVSGKTAQKWVFADGAKLVQEQDIHDLIGKEAFEEEWNSGDIDLHICDMTHAGFAATVSYSNSVSSSAAGRQYALILLNTASRSGLLAVENSITLGYQPASGCMESPRVHMHEQTAFIQFLDVVVTIDTSPASGSEDIIALRDAQHNRFIGSSIGTATRARQAKGGAALVFMPAQGGLIGVEVYKPPIMLERKSEETRATEKLKSKMEQAVYYGDRPSNPISFDVYGQVDAADVAAAAEQLSYEILSCTSKHMPGIPQILPMLNDRLERLRLIMVYIHDNDLMPKLSQTARRLLSRDAEKAKAALELWNLQDKLLGENEQSGDSEETGSSPSTLLSDSIEMLMRQYGAEASGDVVRQFFRTHVEYIDQLLSIVFNNYAEAVSRPMPTAKRTSWVYEADRILVVAQHSILHSTAEQHNYLVDAEHAVIELWTASAPIIHALESLYHATVDVLKARTRELGSAVNQPLGMLDSADVQRDKLLQNDLKELLSKLAAALLINMEARIQVYSEQSARNERPRVEVDELWAKWLQLRPDVIRPLVEMDLAEHAYALAERHEDFETLVWLCHLDIPLAKRDARQGVERVQQYIERFGREFAFVLYQWYIDQDQQAALLNQDEVYAEHVTDFFAERSYPELSWMHHVACRRFGDSAHALKQVQAASTGQADRMLFDSIGKLAAVVELRTNGPTSYGADLLPDFDKDLGSIRLQRDISARIASSGGKRVAPANKAQHYVSQRSAKLDQRPVQKALLSQLVDKVYRGEYLDTEGLVDVLTLKENKGEESGDAAEALVRLAYDFNLASGRKQVAVLSAWRRVFIQDDWEMINNTSGRSEEAQCRLLMSTAAFATMAAIQAKNDTARALPEAYYLVPKNADGQPEPAELSARFPERTPAEIEALMADHMAEIELLRHYVRDCGVDQRVREIAEMMAEMGAGEDDGEMDANPGQNGEAEEEEEEDMAM